MVTLCQYRVLNPCLIRSPNPDHMYTLVKQGPRSKASVFRTLSLVVSQPGCMRACLARHPAIEIFILDYTVYLHANYNKVLGLPLMVDFNRNV